VRGAVTAQLAPLALEYRTQATEILNNGHTVQVSYASGSVLKVAGESAYELKQFHFHAPSENLLDGRRFPLEVHFVHADAAGNLAVIGVFFEEGAPNNGLAKLWKQLPAQVGDKHKLTAKLSATALMPPVQDYYRFSGSLTTPPCSEGVNWLVMKHPITASGEQIEQFARLMGHSNARPAQPLNARVILQ
jgi:carbonic anhydrase